MFKKAVLSFSVLAALTVSFAASAQPTSIQPSASQLDCSDPGRSCSVDRNCCSGSCDKGTCN